MKQTDRIEALGALFTTFLNKAKDRGFIVLDADSDHDHYAQFKLHDGALLGEVSSRQWHEPERPLAPASVAGLAALGFTGGGPEKNFAKDDLPSSPAELARLTDSLLRTAYELDDEYSVTVHYLVFNDVTLPRAQHFTRDMIEKHLRGKGVHFLRDDDGDFRADFQSDETSGPVVVWLVASGPDETVYTVSSVSPDGAAPELRTEAVERCNEWNNEQRWPKATVCGYEGAWHIRTAYDVDLAPGITQDLFDQVTYNAISASLEFWRWLASPQESATTSGDAGDSRDGGG